MQRARTLGNMYTTLCLHLLHTYLKQNAHYTIKRTQAAQSIFTPTKTIRAPPLLSRPGNIEGLPSENFNYCRIGAPDGGAAPQLADTKRQAQSASGGALGKCGRETPAERRCRQRDTI